MGTNHYRTYEKICHNICSWRLSIVKLIHMDINAKKRILLQLSSHVFSMISTCSEGSGYDVMIGCTTEGYGVLKH